MVRALLEQFSGYPALWLACATSGILAPMPEDFPLVYAGTRVADGSWTWGATLAVAVLGVATRDLIAWTVGRLLGDWLLHRHWIRALVGRKSLDRAQRIVTRHGSVAVLFGRFFIGFRAPVFAVAGAMGVPLRAFAAYDLVGLVVAVPLAVAVGYEFGPSVTEALAAVVERTRLVIAIAVLLGVPYVAWKVSAARFRARAGVDDEEKEVV
ncbi:MAG: DedA family protein [Alphaproteobacteria bacterium]|nr:DedA family protein [Alphaproteobacteria bacterium]